MHDEYKPFVMTFRYKPKETAWIQKDSIPSA